MAMDCQASTKHHYPTVPRYRDARAAAQHALVLSQTGQAVFLCYCLSRRRDQHRQNWLLYAPLSQTLWQRAAGCQMSKSGDYEMLRALLDYKRWTLRQ